MDLLFSMGDLGLADPLPESVDIAVRAALTRAIYTGGQAPAQRFRWLRRLLRRGPLLPVALVVTTAVAAAATGVATGVLNLDSAAKHNVNDTPLRLFQMDLPAKSGATPASLWNQTVIPSTVRVIATPTIAGIGKVTYWVANTTQNGICTAIELPGGSWAGLKNFRQVGGALVGCRPTRRQAGWGALIISGFDYTDSEVLTKSGKELVLDYGEITAPGHPTEVRNRYGGRTAAVVDGKYFLLVSHSTGSGIDGTDLVALDASGKIVADERKPLAGTPTTKCVGRYNVRRHAIPGTKRTSLTWSCRRFVRTIAK
jgi:hypothetical protein